MSFDLYFATRPADGRWDLVMDAFEQVAAEGRELTDEELERWAHIAEAVVAVVPDVEETDGDGFRQLDDGVCMQLTMYPGELSIAVPYWFEGNEAVQVVERLRRVATAIESVTDLVAYDPQADAPFLEEGHRSAAAAFDRGAATLRDLDMEAPTRPTPRRWAFWRR